MNTKKNRPSGQVDDVILTDDAGDTLAPRIVAPKARTGKKNRNIFKPSGKTRLTWVRVKGSFLMGYSTSGQTGTLIVRSK